MSRITLFDESGNPVEVDVPDEDEQPQTEQRSNAEWAQLRKATKERDDAKKALAFVQAGIDPEDPKARYFVKGYDGKIDKDAIRAAAVEAGVVSLPPEPGQDPIAQASLEASQRISQASAGAAPDILTDEARLNDAYASGGTEAMLQVARELGLRIAGPQ